MVLHNPNNWHWVNKDVSAWARQWFEENLTKIEAEDGQTKARISKIVSSDGDVDVSQRKGKVITIFDVKLVLEYAGSTTDADDVSGTITIPEVAHDTEEDEFVVCLPPPAQCLCSSRLCRPAANMPSHLSSSTLTSTPSQKRSSL